MEIIDVRAAIDAVKTLEKERYAKVLKLADSHFDEDRVSAEGRGFVSGAYDEICIDWVKEGESFRSSIDIILGRSDCTVEVRDEDLLDEAKEFGRAYEQRFEGENVLLRHNYP